MKRYLSIILVVAVAAFSITGCKKDPFNEKDAIAAQKELLQMKYGYELQIAGINLQIQRVGDSARIAIQNLINKGATDLEILQAKNKLAQSLQDLQNQMVLYRLSDSLSRASSLFNDSLNSFGPSMKKNYTIVVTDYVTSAPVSGATVRVLPYNSASIVTATTDANGVAQFTGLIIDPNALFTVSKTAYAITMVKRSAVDNSPLVSLWNTGNATNKVSGRMIADLDLTNVNEVEGLSGQLITFANTGNYNGQNQTIQFATLTDASGNYSVSLPDIQSGSNWSVTTPDKVKAMQKAYVNYFSDENPATVLPRLDSVGISVMKSNTATGTSVRYGIAGSNVNSNIRAYYLRLPKDSLGNQIIVTTSALGGFLSFLSTTDSLSGIQSLQTGAFTVNNGNSFYAVSDPSYNYPKKADTLDVTLVSLMPNWIEKAPQLKVYINAQGKITKIDYPLTATNTINYANGAVAGKFKNTFIATPAYDAGFLTIRNLNGVRNWPSNSTANVLSLNSSSIASSSINGGRSVTLNFDYAYVDVYDKTIK